MAFQTKIEELEEVKSVDFVSKEQHMNHLFKL
jgi:cell division protein FtsX